MDDSVEPASFPSQLNLPPAAAELASEAARAVRQELRDRSRWKRLQCHRVSLVSERDRGAIYILQIDTGIEFDWTWEGAVAFCPLTPTSTVNDHHQQASEEDLFQHEVRWQGEILEADPINGWLYISVDLNAGVPGCEPFYVRPFEFLAALNHIFNSPSLVHLRSDLPDRLAAASGNIHPLVTNSADVGLKSLRSWWHHSWSILWGPPGTGKTWTTGQQVAAVLADPNERVLVVSTTNQATDAVAISIGAAAQEISARELPAGKLVRLGRGTQIEPFNRLGLMDMLGGNDLPPLQRNESLSKELGQSSDGLEKAFLRQQLSDVRQSVQSSAQRSFLDREVRVVVTTAFKALNLLRSRQLAKFLQASSAPFTTVFIDEAGLISRAAVAALSYLAARRVVLVGDSKQLAPISRVARLLPTRQENWLASSGLSHLRAFEHKSTAVHQLSEQRRMHQDVCKVVSDYQYDGRLLTADEVRTRTTPCPAFLTNYSRTIWFVLDAVTQDLAAIRACRGPNNRSWIRPITPDLLERVLRIDQLHAANGLFLSPFTAQTRAVAECLSKWGFTSWQSSTVHAQQGSEADIVIFDTVNAGSCGWPYEEWKRLINVGLSRAREGVILLASRAEMDEPFLRPLISSLQPSTLTEEGSQPSWTVASNSNRRGLKISLASTAEEKPKYASQTSVAASLGARIKDRQELPPVLSRDQQRLVNLNLDGKPRLVRGVAGSGKSMVLAQWLARTAKKRAPHDEGIIWAVYANRSLDKLLRESIESAWDDLHSNSLFEIPPFPWDKVSLLHIKDVLKELLPSMELTFDAFEFDYDRAAAEFLSRHEKKPIEPRCASLFVDEAQDMGPSTLKLLMSLIAQSDPHDSNSRSANIFYDNAQNIYGRKTPKWSDFGLDLRGRSTILRDSFRSTAPILELAANVLHLLANEKRDDEAELLRLDLLQSVTRNGHPWLLVNYNQVSGPKPALRLFQQREEEFKAIARHLIHYIQHEQISPNDICLLYNSQSVAQQLRAIVEPALETIGVELSFQTNRSFQRLENTLVASTPNSFKGYESEVVVIPAVDRFVARGGDILAHSLYVAMTRARSLLAIYGVFGHTPASRIITDTLNKCNALQNWTPPIENSDR